MCQSVEDCLVSRIGFRVFLTIVGSLLSAVVFINIHYVLSRYSEDLLRDGSGGGGSLSGLDGAVSSAVVTDLDSRQVVPLNINNNRIQSNRTKVLIWTDDEGHFFNQLSKQIIYLRSTPRNGCASLSQCAFSSDKWKLSRADAVLVAAKNTSTLKQLPIFGPMVSSDIDNKLWTLFLKDPTYHEAFLDMQGDPKKFDFLVSYLPNSTFPLVRIHFESKGRDAVFATGPTKSTIFGNAALAMHEHHKSQESKRHQPRRYKIPDRDPISSERHKRETEPENKRIVATIIDECETPGNREEYIREMKKSGIFVQIYGKCGVPCPGHSKSDCFKHIDKFYKFYLTFDSHICQHYLSEDLWQLLSSTSNLVPVVFGGVNYVEVLPHDGYIDALNQTPASLAQTLLYLYKNEQAYQAYLSWRDRYLLVIDEWPCILCQALTERMQSRQKRVENHIQLSSEGPCTSWPQLNFSN